MTISILNSISATIIFLLAIFGYATERLEYNNAIYYLLIAIFLKVTSLSTK